MAQGSKPETVEFARELRKKQTPIEAMLWKHLRAGQLNGFKFRRQHPIGHYVADFCCEELKLVIELDGDSHFDNRSYDAARTSVLSKLGYSVIRLKNRDVYNNLDGVLERVFDVCNKQTERPHPNPLPQERELSVMEVEDDSDI